MKISLILERLLTKISKKNKMIRYLFSLVLIFILSSCSISLKSNKKPDWLDDNYRKKHFPSEKYYVVFSEKNNSDFSTKNKSEREVELRKELESKLIKGIVDKISVSMTSTEQQIGNTNYEFVSSVLLKTNQSSSAVLFEKQENFYINKRKNTLSGIIYVKKTALAKGYKLKIDAEISYLLSRIKNLNSKENEAISPLAAINVEFNNIKDDIEKYTIIASINDNELNIKFNELSKEFTQLKFKYEDTTLKVINLLLEVDKLYNSNLNNLVNSNLFEDISNKLEEALIYDPGNMQVLAKKDHYKSLWIKFLKEDKNEKIRKEEYQSAIKILDRLIILDNTNDQLHLKEQKDLIINYFNKTINDIESFSKNDNISTCFVLLDQISKYSYVNIEKFQNTKVKIDNSYIDKKIKEIQNLAYKSDFLGAADVCKTTLKIYPDNMELKDEFDKILISIKKEKKIEFKKTRPTRYVVELNYSLANVPLIIKDNSVSPSIKVDLSKVDFNNPLAYYQFGLYRKINIKDKLKFVNSKRSFAYSQVGLRYGYLNMSNYPFLNPTDNSKFFFKNSKLIQLEASFIWRRFFMFNIGYVSETLPEITVGNNIITKSNNYLCSTVGLRFPIRSVHLTTDFTGFKDPNSIIKLYAKAGVSLNIGLSKKYNKEDKKYIENEVLKLRDN